MAGSNWGVVSAPQRLDELMELARADLTALRPGVLLEWSFLHARYVGRLARAEKRLAHAERHWGIVQDRLNLTLYPPTPEQRAALEDESSAVALLTFQEGVEEAAACVKACEHVLALLERALRKRADKRQEPNQKQRPRAA